MNMECENCHETKLIIGKSEFDLFEWDCIDGTEVLICKKCGHIHKKE